MSLVKLSNIGKIYVSEGGAAVGIRGVNLEFERGEFVAITGRSGSGKTTLLNVISGIDTYEEGELYIDGAPTSHYSQSDFEEYREKYISFIFQEYNIVDSFTVLQNVELALLHIKNPAERKKKALDLINRVGLEAHAKKKGSHLSGGQKQRTVIARALAKDSPIILADEPTGNLDSKSSEEILSLMYELSKDKLVIIVTHDYQSVAEYATRHVRIYDGAVESDTHVKEHTEPSGDLHLYESGRQTVKDTVRNATYLGITKFTARPKLSFFITIVMIIASVGIFLLTSSLFADADISPREKLFEHIDGRLIITKVDGSEITEDELAKLKEETGAESYLHFDKLLERVDNIYLNGFFSFRYTYDYSGTPDIGRKPQNSDEVLLKLPISFSRYIDENDLSSFQKEIFYKINSNLSDYKLVGIDYFYDNSKPSNIVFTKEGFFDISYKSKESDASKNTIYALFQSTSGYYENYYADEIMEWDELEENEVAFAGMVSDFVYGEYKEGFENEEDFYAKTLNLNVECFTSNGYADSYTYMLNISEKTPDISIDDEYKSVFIVSPTVARDIKAMTTNANYKQASLFYGSDREAEGVIKTLRGKGYLAVTSDAYKEDVITLFVSIISYGMIFMMFVLAVVFIGFLMSLCTSKAIMSTRADLGIFRSMGIGTSVIKLSSYMQMLVSLLISYIAIVITAVIVYVTPSTNAVFTFIHAKEYIVIAVGMLILMLRVTKKYVGKLFGESVRKTLKGGASE